MGLDMDLDPDSRLNFESYLEFYSIQFGIEICVS
jgi:hypothetical protein